MTGRQIQTNSRWQQVIENGLSINLQNMECENIIVVSRSAGYLKRKEAWLLMFRGLFGNFLAPNAVLKT